MTALTYTLLPKIKVCTISYAYADCGISISFHSFSTYTDDIENTFRPADKKIVTRPIIILIIRRDKWMENYSIITWYSIMTGSVWTFIIIHDDNSHAEGKMSLWVRPLTLNFEGG